MLGLVVLFADGLTAGVSAQTPWSVAITIDDVPMTGGSACGRDEIVPVNDAILRVLARRGAKAVAFFVPGGPCQGAGDASATDLAARWRTAGHEVGNHTYTHRDYNGLAADSYIDEIERAHEALEPVLIETAQSARWFRPPLLHTGADIGRRRALDNWLSHRDYRMGVVTIDNQEWVFAAAYDRARACGDASLTSAIVTAYVEHILESAEYYRALSRSLFEREAPQVLLLHANRLNADHLEDVLAALEGAGAHFVTLREAVDDPAYRSPDDYLGPRGLSWLQRWALTRGVTPPPEPREPGWVQFVASAPSGLGPQVNAELDAANRTFSQAWIAGNSAAIVRLYSDDAVLHPPAGGVIASPAAVREFWERLSQQGDRGGHQLETTLRRELGEREILEMGRWRTAHRREGALHWQTGCYTLVWRLEADRRWRIVYDGWTGTNEASWACRPR